MKKGTEVKVRLTGRICLSAPGVFRHAINAPMVLPKMKESKVAIESRKSVHGNARAIKWLTVTGNWVSE